LATRPPPGAADDTPDRRIAHARRLREQQLKLLHELQAISSELARTSDLIEGWFDAATAARLKRSGLLRLDELQQRIALGGRWYRWVPAIGPTKAVRIARYLSCRCRRRSLVRRWWSSTRPSSLRPRRPGWPERQARPPPPAALWCRSRKTKGRSHRTLANRRPAWRARLPTSGRARYRLKWMAAKV
jgi:hypothetical protein